VEQDLVELESPSDWERMRDEYNMLGLSPSGHVMARLRPRFNGSLSTSRDIDKLSDGADVVTAGLVIRRQRPHAKVVFMTLEDEFGLIPLMVFPQIFEQQEYEFKSPFLIVKGKFSRREGTYNVVVSQIKPFRVLDKAPQSKNWR
jgi:error-prone DNA polymerase